ncbi:hypothetical protein LTR66_003127 [Elasticomyces elasticus]|nr:hypothetical protein LTR50_002982 [Elasticomyces elasticus]KAK4997467.1 hypothetical protein LTR66_003127 [Elasticomyces elasticus]
MDNSPQNELMNALSTSGFFDSACSNQMREAETGVIDLSEDDEEAVEHMIHYFYHLDYLNQVERQPSALFRHRALSDARRRIPKKLDLSQIEDPLVSQAAAVAPKSPLPPPADRHDSFNSIFDKVPNDPTKTRTRSPSLKSACSDSESDVDEADDDYETDDSHLLLHTRVYALAEKYDIPSLKALARRKFEMAMACYYDSPEFADAIEEVYCSTIDSDRGLRDVVIQAFRSHPQLASTQDVFSVIKQTPTLAFELWKVERGIPVA